MANQSVFFLEQNRRELFLMYYNLELFYSANEL